MDTQRVVDLENFVLSQDPVFRNANTDYYHFCNVYVYVNSSMRRQDALRNAQEKWKTIKSKNTSKISCKIMDT